MQLNIELKLKKAASLIDKKMNALLPKPSHLGDVLSESLRYAALSTGKRIRGFLVITTAELFDAQLGDVLQVASAIEFIHAYSLVHDDLPSMDNDDYRRGQLSCHKKYGEAIAVLTGDALLTYAFELLADDIAHPDHKVRIDLIKLISKAIGLYGMVGGQALDLSAQQDLDMSEIMQIQRMKTGELFFASCQAGAILGGATEEQLNALRIFSEKLGLAFQITDDLLDTPKSDEGHIAKETIVSHLGHDKTIQYLHNIIDAAINSLSIFGNKADTLRELAHFIIARKN